MGAAQSTDGMMDALGCCTGNNGSERRQLRAQRPHQTFVQAGAYHSGVQAEAAELQRTRSSWNRPRSVDIKSGAYANDFQRQLSERPHVMNQPIIKEDDRPLYHAARLGDLEQVNALISRGIPADERDEYGRSPLHFAAWNGALPVVKRLMGEGADYCARTFDDVSAADCAYKQNHMATGHFLALHEMGLSEAQIFYRFQADGLSHNINSVEDKQRLTRVYYNNEKAVLSAAGLLSSSSFKKKNETVPTEVFIPPKRSASSKQLQPTASPKDRDSKSLSVETRAVIGPGTLKRSDSVKKKTSLTANIQPATAASPSSSFKLKAEPPAAARNSGSDNRSGWNDPDMVRGGSSQNLARTASGGKTLTRADNKPGWNDPDMVRGSSSQNLARAASGGKTLTRVASVAVGKAILIRTESRGKSSD